LNLWIFDSLLEARVIVEDWRIDYNQNRLDQQPPTPSYITPRPIIGALSPPTHSSHVYAQRRLLTRSSKTSACGRTCPWVAIGVTVDGKRDMLGMWIGTGGEGAKYWLQD